MCVPRCSGSPITTQTKGLVTDFLFKDTSFKFEALRAAGFAVDNGADLSEVLLTGAGIPEGDEEPWMREWKSTADRVCQRLIAHDLSAACVVTR